MNRAGGRDPRGTRTGSETTRAQRRALAATLRAWEGRSHRADDGRHYLDLAVTDGEGPSGGVAGLAIEGRGLPWPTDLEKEADRLTACERMGLVLRRADGQVCGSWRGCGSRICPVCVQVRARRALARWAPVMQAAVADGAVVHHLTLTQVADAAPGGLVLRGEREFGWRGVPPLGGRVAGAVGGEGLLGAYTRWRHSWDRLRHDRASKADFRTAVGGCLVGLEWTGRRRGSSVPRWHVHAHVLTVHPREEAAEGYDALNRLRGWWCDVSPGARRRAQYLQRVGGDAPTPEAAEDPSFGVVEVLKYPFKVSTLTAAQRIEVVAVAKGLRLHQASGGWYHRPKVGPREPYATWLKARPEKPDAKLLYSVTPENERRLYVGDPNGGRGRFSWGMWGDVFEADAEPFARLIGAEPAEPGQDWADGLFEDDADEHDLDDLV